MKLESQRILITGAGGGIGRALARALAIRGARLCALEHSREAADRLCRELEPLGAGPLLAIGDVTQALRRELAGTGVGITYVSPRTVHQRCAGWDPHPQEAYLGFLEGLFARLNGILSVTIRPAALILALWAASALADIFPQPPRRDVTIAA